MLTYALKFVRWLLGLVGVFCLVFAVAGIEGIFSPYSLVIWGAIIVALVGIGGSVTITYILYRRNPYDKEFLPQEEE